MNDSKQTISFVDESNFWMLIACYVNNPSLYEYYPIRKEDYTDYGKVACLAVHGLKRAHEERMKNIPVDFMELITSGQNNQDEAKEAVSKINYYIKGATDEQFNNCFIRNQKLFLLKQYHNKGFNISPFWVMPEDVNLSDEDKSIKERRFETASLQDIIDHYVKYTMKVEYSELEGSFNPWQPYDPRELPNAKDEMTWVIDEILLQETFNIVVGPAKSGKSQLSYQMAFCLQNGIPFLGNQTVKGDVLYLDLELSQTDIKYRYKTIYDYYSSRSGEKYKMPLVYSLADEGPELDVIDERISLYLQVNPQIKYIFYDNFYVMFKGNLNDSSETTAALKLIKKIAKHGKDVTSVLVCHTNKADGKTGGSNDPIYAMSGSNAFAGFVDESIAIQLDKNDARKVVVAGRHVKKHSIECSFDFLFHEVHRFEQREEKIQRGNSPDELKQLYPELSEIIGIEGATLKKINETYPGETKDSLEKKGFYYSGNNKAILLEEIKTRRFYPLNPRKRA